MCENNRYNKNYNKEESINTRYCALTAERTRNQAKQFSLLENNLEITICLMYSDKSGTA